MIIKGIMINRTSLDERSLKPLIDLFMMSTGQSAIHIKIETRKEVEETTRGNFNMVLIVDISYPVVNSKREIEWKKWSFDTRHIEDIPNIIRDIKLNYLLS